MDEKLGCWKEEKPRRRFLGCWTIEGRVAARENLVALALEV